MARKDNDFLLIEEKDSTGKYLVICVVIAILGFGGYALMNLNKASSPGQPGSLLKTEDFAENKTMPQTDATKSVKTTINFAYDSSTISENEKARLEEFVVKVKGGKGEIKVEGYADGAGTAEYNNELSTARANATIEMLKKLELTEKVNVSVQGLGMGKPIANNDSEEGRAKNRRVEILFTPVN
jgi:outer membrane protein OmpA-like peptidoglycan-associated protein